MKEPLKTEDAVTEVTCLEDKILLDEGKQGGEDLSNTSAYLETWQVEAARFIKVKMNTKLANVYRCSIHHGEKVIREEIGESADHDYIHETERMWNLSTMPLHRHGKCPNKLMEVIGKLQTLDHGVELGVTGDLTEDPIRVNYRDSVGSAIHDTWVMMADESQSSALRTMITIGLGYSDLADEFYPEYGEEAKRQAIRMFRSVRTKLEMYIADYVSSAVVEWEIGGYSDEEKAILHEIHGMMTTDYQKQVRTGMDMVGMYEGNNPQISSSVDTDWEQFF